MDKAVRRVGDATLRAIDAGNPAALVVAIIATNHSGKARKLFRGFANRFLSAFEESRSHPGSHHALMRSRRAKAALDLVRARMTATGQRWPTDETMLDMAREADMPRVVHRTAA